MPVQNDPNHKRVAIDDIFCRVLEQLGCIFAVADEPDNAVAPDVYLRATVAFNGQRRGHLTLLTAPAVAFELAANMLGVDIDDEDAGAEALDALGELANVVVGQLITETLGSEAVCDLDHPDVERLVTTEGWLELAARPQTLAFDCDGEWLLVEWVIED